MIRLKELLVEQSKSELISKMKKHFADCSKKYFREDNNKYPAPNFTVRTNFRHIGAFVPQRNEFIMNLDFAQDDEAIKATMYHETIHYYQTHKFGFNRILHKIHGYHDDYFDQKMKEINSGEGKQLVTVRGEYTSIKSGKATKPFWVYVLAKGNELNTSWSPTKNTSFIDRLKRIKDYYKDKYDKGFVFQTDLVTFKESPRATMGGRSVQSGNVKPGDKYYNDFRKEIDSAKKEYF